MKPKSASNRQLTLLRKLNRKKYRIREQLYTIEGGRAVQQVLNNDIIAVKALFVDESQQYWKWDGWRKYEETQDWYIMSESDFMGITDTENPQGILALCHMPPQATISELSTRSGIIVALDAVQDPGNLGTIIRTASWFGIHGLIAGKGTVDLFHPKVVRSTAGATGTVPYINGDLKEVLSRYRDEGWSVFLLDAGERSALISEVEVSQKVIIVVGNEAHGVHPELTESSYRKVHIPSKGDKTHVESLNAGIATSIALYEVTK